MTEGLFGFFCLLVGQSRLLKRATFLNTSEQTTSSIFYITAQDDFFNIYYEQSDKSVNSKVLQRSDCRDLRYKKLHLLKTSICFSGIKVKISRSF